VGHPRPKTRISPAVTEEVNAAPQLVELQLATYIFCTSDGVAPPAVTELDAPSVNVLPRVSVGVEGGFWPDHPSAKASVFPETTVEVNARPHEAELQFEL